MSHRRSHKSRRSRKGSRKASHKPPLPRHDILTNDDIDRFFGGQRAYGGCFLQDELPPRIRPGKMYVINIDRAADHKSSDREIGTHWIAVDNRSPNDVIMFDPFGMPPDDRILAWMKTARSEGKTRLGMRKSIVYNTEQVQDADSECCGWFCLYLLSRPKGRGSFVSTLVNGFEHGFQDWRNDLIVKRLARATYYNIV